MIVERRTYVVQAGGWNDLVALVKEEMAAMGTDFVYRMYRSEVGRFGELIHEIEFQDLAEYQKFWTTWNDTRSTPQFWARMNKVSRGGGGNELWRLIE